MNVKAAPLTSDSFQLYGELIAADGSGGVPANLGTAQRFSRLTQLQNLRPSRAVVNISIYRCAPTKKFPLEVQMLERHAFSSQVFIPMAGVTRFLVLVAKGGDAPDLSTLRAFVATGLQGICYAPGTWHYPLMALDRGGDFTCLVFEDGSAADCEERSLEKKIRVDLS